MTMTVVKMDRRYDGHDRFSHRVEFTGWQHHTEKQTRVAQWVRARNWLWKQFGPSGELFCAKPMYFDGVQPVWAWDAEKSSLYLSKEAYTMFMLRKEFWENVENL